MQDTGCLGLVHWDDPEGWYEGGGGRELRVGNSCTPVVDSCQCMAKPIQYCKVKKKKKCYFLRMSSRGRVGSDELLIPWCVSAPQCRTQLSCNYLTHFQQWICSLLTILNGHNYTYVKIVHRPQSEWHINYLFGKFALFKSSILIILLIWSSLTPCSVLFCKCWNISKLGQSEWQSDRLN